MRITISLPKSIALVAAASAALALTACDSSSAPNMREEYISVETVEDATPAADEQSVPAAAEVAVASKSDAAPIESLPPEVRSSEESVQPDSETLFY